MSDKIKSKITEIRNSGRDVEAVLAGEKDSELLYAASPIRQNLVSWLDVTGKKVFVAGDTSGILAEKFSQMGAKEVSEVVLEDFKKIFATNDSEKYDLIFILGGADENCKAVSEKLSEDGRLIIAVDNKLGIRQWSRMNDVISNQVNTLPGDESNENSNQKLYLESEIDKLMSDAGLTVLDTYYPVPDMTFPRIVYNRKCVPTKGFFEISTPEYSSDKISFFEETEFMNLASLEGAAQHFANSFVVVAGKDSSVTDTRLIYARYNSERRKEFRTDTFIYESVGENGQYRDVVKRAACPEAEKHLNQIENSKLQLDGMYKNVSLAGLERKADGLHFEFIEGRSLSDVIGEMRDELVLLKVEINRLISPLFEFADDAGEGGKKEGMYNFDMIPSNVIVKPDGSLVLIDYEWVFDEASARSILSGSDTLDTSVMKDFLRYRTLLYLYRDNKDTCFSNISLGEFMRGMGISAEMEKRFEQMENNFQQYVYGEGWKSMYTKNYLKNVTRVQDMLNVYKDKLRHNSVLENANKTLKSLLIAGGICGVVLVIILIMIILKLT